MCKPIGSVVCCCLECGLRLLFMLICSIVGILLVIGVIVYFVFFHESTRIDSNKFRNLGDEIYRNRFMNG
ncbi:protein midgut expression 1 [Drosophila innubila]|uniref:protein midgut expression 1 n=1 Tax=Drosophila innubila TaxID=198719 RepID=UPI00148D3E6E|nr:protein midgut expression 1 [Drosophila innubila]